MKSTVLNVGILTGLFCASSLTPALGGKGTVRTVGGVHYLDFCVSIRYTATGGEIADIQRAFTDGNVVFADATDGQFRFGNISIVNSSGASQQAEVWILPDSGRGFATLGLYGNPGSHVTLYTNYFEVVRAPSAGYSIAHEMSHHFWGVADEYSGPDNCAAPTMTIDADCEVVPGSPTANFCLMDNYYLRGGGMGAFSPPTLNEFCVAANHDPDMDTWQQCVWGQSCWQRIATHPNPARRGLAPAILPISAAPVVAAPTFRLPGAARRFVLSLDRSGSMTIVESCVGGSATRLDIAKDAGEIVVDLTNVGDQVGLTSFSTTATEDFPGGGALRTIGGVTDRNDAKAAINAAIADGWTSIEGGLVSSQNLITGTPNSSCMQTIFLITDGWGNRDRNGNPAVDAELVPIPSLQANDISVVAVGVGLASAGNLMTIAGGTGGRYFAVPSVCSLPALMAALTAEEAGGGVLARDAAELSGKIAGDKDSDGDVDFNDLLTVLNGFGVGFNFDDLLEVQNNFGATNPQLTLRVMVDAQTQEADFVLPWPDRGDDLDMSLISPSGAMITHGTASPNLSFIDGGTYEIYRVRRPLLETGIWTVKVTASTLVNGRFDLVVTTDSAAYTLAVAPEKPYYVAPEIVRIIGTPQSDGVNVIGAQVTGVVRRPDGTTVPITLRDDGSAASGDTEPNDGAYSALFSAYAGSGAYTFELTAVNQNGHTYEGEAIHASVGDPSNARNVPPFTRASAGTAVVLVPSGQDCNGNGFDDAEDILMGRSLDVDRNGIPDECCPGVNFDDLTTGKAYKVGEVIPSGPQIKLRVAPFFLGPNCSNQSSNGLAVVSANNQACRSGNELSINNANLEVVFGSPVSGLTLYYGDFGGSLNLVINGDCRVVEDFRALDGTVIGGVRIDVQQGPQTPCGRLLLSGMIGSFEIGGQEFFVDDIVACPDCNQNGSNDLIDIATENSRDTNGNGIPDECEQIP